MTSYKRSFGRCRIAPNPVTGIRGPVCQQTALQQALVSLTLIFIALGGGISGIVGNHFGRRGTIQVGALLAATGAAGMLGTAGNFTAYLACKCIGGVGLGHLIATAGIYGAECTVAKSRGMLLALYSIGFGLGNVLAAAVCWGSARYKSNLAWQTPIICQIPFSALLFFGVYLFPESPRWLLTKGRDDAAKRSFGWYYAKPHDHADVLLQVEDVINHIELGRLNGSTAKWTDIYHGLNFKRTVISGLIMVGLAITGSKFVIPYGALFLAQAGTKNPFLNNFIIGCCILAGTTCGPWVIENGGRRFAMLWGYSTMTVCMLIIGIVGSALGQKSDTAKVVLLVFLFLWALLFGVFIGASVWVGAPEQHSLQLRTYGQASTTLIYQIFGFASSFYGSYMLNPHYGNMGLNIAYFHAGMLLFFVAALLLLIICRCNFCHVRPCLLASSRNSSPYAGTN